MKYLVVKDGIITNVIVSEPDFAKSIGAAAFYEGADIGGKYDPPYVLTTEERIAKLEAQNKTLATSNQFLEDCLVEMAGVVYG